MSVLLLQACASAPQERPGPQAVPELTLNLPAQEKCACTEQPPDDTFLERGFTALVAGEHVEAVRYFQRYARLESSAAADWEADIAIAFDSMLPGSPFHDPRAARKTYRRLQKRYSNDWQVHEKVLLMRDSLAALLENHHRVEDMETEIDGLREELARREEALRRLRELTLGQKAAAP